ncbi:MAG: dihydrofolate reductase [Gemmatimonadetes bacterium]|nr:dihydrofolate reductase [Gemmatimonadota bacterium]NIQ59313.1 dihydrofolate reductase [Gemmatimonadota bacterium]NIU79499.1 dihydrofolate reductase [Gammaproteobacteria bacterium]NIX48137.1 dihydrofolate reductase [Gemmatimonadota bacterium]NIY12525.1 dihydrofolate reductase [Gemmatimonadota bacterium]
MRRLIFWNLMTLDGCFEGPEQWDLAFHTIVWGEEMQRFSLDQASTADLLLFGRVTYQGMAGFWATEQAESEHPAITKFMNRVQKMVFSRTLASVEWDNTMVESGDAVEAVAALKREEGGDILLFGSATLADALSRAGLIDEYRIGLVPVVLRGGAPLFKPGGPELRLELVDTQVLSTGGVILSYRPTAPAPDVDQP